MIPEYHTDVRPREKLQVFIRIRLADSTRREQVSGFQLQKGKRTGQQDDTHMGSSERISLILFLIFLG